MRITTLHCVRLIASIAAAFAFQSAALAQPACKGRDMLAELRETDPLAHARIVAAAAATENTEAMLWRIEKAGLAPSFLLGTAHVSDDRITTLSPNIRAALAAAKTMAFEVADLSSASMAAAVSNNVHLFLYADGRQLDRTLKSDQFAKAVTVLAAAGMPPEVAARIKPWLVFMLLAIPQCERQRQSTGRHALDVQLTDNARRRGVPVVGLETIQSQLEALAAIPEEQQVAMLQAVLHYADRTEDQLETMMQLYLGRRMGFAVPFQHELARRAGVAPGAFAAFEKEIVGARNKGMAEAAKPLLEKGAAFIGVGALHLVGADGLVALLRRAGYTVAAVE